MKNTQPSAVCASTRWRGPSGLSGNVSVGGGAAPNSIAAMGDQPVYSFRRSSCASF